MSPTRKIPWPALATAMLAGAILAGALAWQLHLHGLSRQIEQKRGALRKLVISGDIPPNQEVMAYFAGRGERIQARYDHWARRVVAPLPAEATGADAQLFFQEQLHQLQLTLERLEAARELPTPEQLGFPKELPPADTVPRLLAQLGLIEDGTKLALAQRVHALSSVKIDDPQALVDPETEEPVLLRLPVRMRLAGSLPVIVKVLGSLRHAMPIIDIQDIRLATGSQPDVLDVEIVMARYLPVARGEDQPPAPRGTQKGPPGRPAKEEGA